MLNSYYNQKLFLLLKFIKFFLKIKKISYSGGGYRKALRVGIN